jgi:hypothetical protein
MYRAQPVGNRLLHKKWEDHTQELHRRRLRTIKASVDNKPPRDFIHLRANMKRAQMEEGAVLVGIAHVHSKPYSSV